MNDSFTLKGTVQFFKNGELFQTVNNLVVDAGKTWILNTIKAGTGTAMSHIAVGSGTNAAVAGDTALQTEITRVTLTTAGGVVAGTAITFTATFNAGVGTGTWSEAGILNNSSGGTLLARTVYTAFTKGAADQITIIWTIST